MAWIPLSRIAEIDCEIDKLYEKIGVGRYPKASLVEIVEATGLEVFKYNFEDHSRQVMGAIDFGPKKPIIYLNKHNHPNNQQFTLAHELGHYVLGHRDKNVQFRIDFESDIYPQGADSRRQELEANYFAGALLMPADLIREQLEREDLSQGITAEELERLKNYFRVSGPAIKTWVAWLRRSEYGHSSRGHSAVRHA